LRGEVLLINQEWRLAFLFFNDPKLHLLEEPWRELSREEPHEIGSCRFGVTIGLEHCLFDRLSSTRFHPLKLILIHRADQIVHSEVRSV
jgi:hypothetical protein